MKINQLLRWKYWALGLLASVALIPVVNADNVATIKNLQTWAQRSVVVKAVTKANQTQARWNATQKRHFERQWRQAVKTKQGAMLKQAHDNAAAKYLSKMQTKSKGQYQMITVYSQKKAVVAMTAVPTQAKSPNWRIWKKVMAGKDYSGKAKLDKALHMHMQVVAVPVKAKGGAVVGAMVAKVKVSKASRHHAKGKQSERHSHKS